MNVIFPFSKGIRWEIKSGIVTQRVPLHALSNRLSNKEINIISYGGLLESFLSLYFLEVCNYYFTTSDLFCMGTCPNILLKANGLAKKARGIEESTLKKYPVPLFFDKADNAYFNCLYDCWKRYNLNKNNYYNNVKPIFTQILNNSLMDFNKNLIPKFRNRNIYKDKVADLIKISKFNDSKPYILLFPDAHEFSKYDDVCLDWTPAQIRSLDAIVRNNNYQLIVLAEKPNKYYGVQYVFKFNLELLLFFLFEARAVLSRTIDFLLLAMFFTNAKLISLKPSTTYLNLKSNSKSIGHQGDIYIKEQVSPAEVLGLVGQK